MRKCSNSFYLQFKLDSISSGDSSTFHGKCFLTSKRKFTNSNELLYSKLNAIKTQEGQGSAAKPAKVAGAAANEKPSMEHGEVPDKEGGEVNSEEVDDADDEDDEEGRENDDDDDEDDEGRDSDDDDEDDDDSVELERSKRSAPDHFRINKDDMRLIKTDDNDASTDIVDKIEEGDYSFNPLDYEGYTGLNFGKPQKPEKPNKVKPPRQPRPMREQ